MTGAFEICGNKHNPGPRNARFIQERRDERHRPKQHAGVVDVHAILKSTVCDNEEIGIWRGDSSDGPKGKTRRRTYRTSRHWWARPVSGRDYQIEYAVLQSLYIIWQHQYEPLRSFSIAIEPRVLHSEAVTRWDIRTQPPLIVSEAKANLSKDDFVEFLQRAGKTNDLDASPALVDGRCSTPLLAAIRLNGIATELSVVQTI